jgi:hypothetical protein
MTHEDHDASRENKDRDCRPPKKHLPFLVRSTAVHFKVSCEGEMGTAVAPLPPQSHEDKHRAASEREDRYDREIFQHVTSMRKWIPEARGACGIKKAESP